ncbi:MAG: DUF5696 domain-containing protein [Defluviitaleaceae bacterium]|nr:DUF5696 domain-containing protein [Defluviitaleaceae bacterium]
MNASAKRAWRNRLIFVGVIAAAIIGYVIYINSFNIYDFERLTVVQNFGEARTFSPLGSALDGRVRAAQTDYLALYISEADTSIAVVDLRNGHVWYSTPPDAAADTRANPFWHNIMRSHVGFDFFNEARREQARWLFPDSIYHEQFEIFSIFHENEARGVRIEYVIGNLDIGIDFLPFFIEEEFFYERIMHHPDIVESRADTRTLIQFWFPSQDEPGFMQMTEGVRAPIHTENMLRIFETVGWTAEDTVRQNALSGVETEIDLDYFLLTIEFVLDENRLIANLPMSQFTTSSVAHPSVIDFMQFFGAGGTDAEGFMLVPSGSGGIIMFNNGKEREEPFRSAVYGLNPLVNIVRPQVTQPVRLPIFGMQNDGAAFLAQVYSGAGLAVVNAGVSGGTTDFNTAWFRFVLRASTEITMAGAGTDMAVIQEAAYTGDITVIYHFIAGENPGVGEMAQVYQDFLVERGVLTPLDGPGNRSFYMDVVGAIDARRHIVGTPYTTTEVMTTLEDAERFVSLLNEGGVDTIQMQLHGWLNRGINHDVAKNVRRVRGVGSRQEMLDLNERLQESGGGLHPAVNFQLTNWHSRNFRPTFESARHLAGYDGSTARHASRDSITMWFSPHINDWYYLVHPGALPFHIDRFLPAYENRTGMDGLALTDMGDILTESLFRRNAVDRESARLIVVSQLGRMSEEIPNLVISGGNDYTFPYASHLVGVPTQADLQYIIDYEVPFFPMVVHGFIEFAGVPANMREHYSPQLVLLNSMATGASPRYMFTQAPTRVTQFTPHERLYSTHYLNWMQAAIEHYHIFNEVYAPLRAERIVNFEILAGRYMYIGGQQVTVTEFSDGTRIYVNNTAADFNAGGVVIPAEWFVVQGGTR